MGRFTEGGVIYEELPDGNVRVVGYEDRTIGPVNPSLQFEAPKAQADARRAAADATVAEAEAPYAASIAQANAREAEAKAAMAARDAQRGRPSLEGAAYKDALGAYYAAQQLEGVIADIEMRYREGPGRTGFPTGVVDYLPTAANQRFDKAVSGARGPVIQALGFSATQMNTPAEAQMNIGGYLPKSSDYDSTIQDTIARLKDLQRTTMERSVAVLGGIPDENGVIRPLSQVPPERLPNALRQTRVTEGQDNQAAGFNADTRRLDLPPEYQAAHAAFIAANPNGIDPEAYVRFRSALDERFNQTPDPEAYRAWANEATQTLQQGGTINLTVPGPEVQMSTLEQVRNNMAVNPLGAAAIGAADMGSFGGVSALAGDQMAALRAEQPLPMLGGEIAGAIGGTAALGRLGRETLGRIIPQGKQGSQFLRDLLTDTTYGGIYGTVTEGDPLTGAAAAGIGSGLGQGAGKLVGSTIGGVAQSAPVQALRDAGVRMTTGQRMGGIPKAIEDAATSVPVLGDIIGARRLEGLQDFNQAAFREAGAPIGARVSQTGREGVEELLGTPGQPGGGAVGAAYDAALQGVDIPLDQQFLTDLTAAGQSASNRLPPDYASRFDLITRNRLGPAIKTGNLTGTDYQQALRGLKEARRTADRGAPGFEQDYKESLTGVIDALEAQMGRGGAQDVIDNLGLANEAYRASRTVGDAVSAAKNSVNEIGTFTPAQLNTAAERSAKKYGSRQFGDLIDNAQTVLPSSIPDSGTGRRAMQMALPASLAGGGAGIGGLIGGAQGAQVDGPGALLGGVEGAQTGAIGGLTLGTLLAVLGTRGGQQALNKALFDRAPGARKLGDFIDRYKGLAGTAMIPLTMQDVR